LHEKFESLASTNGDTSLLEYYKELAQAEAKYPDPKYFLIGFSSTIDNKTKLTERRQTRQSADFESYLNRKAMFSSVVNTIDTEVRKKSKEQIDRIADINKYHAETTKAEKTVLTKYYSTERPNEGKVKNTLNSQENATTTKFSTKITKKKVIKNVPKNSYRRTRNDNKSMIQNIKTVVLEKAKMAAHAHEKSELYCIAENASPECESYREYDKGFSDIEIDKTVKDLSKNKIKLGEYIRRQHELKREPFKESSISHK